MPVVYIHTFDGRLPVFHNLHDTVLEIFKGFSLCFHMIVKVVSLIVRIYEPDPAVEIKDTFIDGGEYLFPQILLMLDLFHIALYVIVHLIEGKCELANLIPALCFKCVVFPFCGLEGSIFKADERPRNPVDEEECERCGYEEQDEAAGYDDHGDCRHGFIYILKVTVFDDGHFTVEKITQVGDADHIIMAFNVIKQESVPFTITLDDP